MNIELISFSDKIKLKQILFRAKMYIICHNITVSQWELSLRSIADASH